MEQKPMRGLAPLDPPSPDVARQYLQEADAVRARRDRQGGSQVQGWAIIVTAIVTGVFLTAHLVVVDSGRPAVVPVFVFVIMIAAQIVSGATERDGVRVRVPRNRAAFVAIVVLSVLGILASFAVQIVAPEAPFVVIAAPLWTSCLIFAGLGVAHLRTATGDGRIVPQPPFEGPARLTTLVVGSLLAATIAVVSLDDLLLSSVLAIVIGSAFVVGVVGARTDWGLSHLGQVWRWPQYGVGALGATALLGVTLNASAGSPVDPLLGVAAAVVVALSTVVVAIAPTPTERRDVE
ncbi:hypothetical protein AUC47_06670 [Microbacterium sp. SZ1]|uniref:hypothetical protein n=1 Tax=Microbacterium sp. SZ1 TaxID=1849736 RepID=UPI000BBCCCD4|nr:hypothetical protein [Microbacterium sp. SZ1]PCE13495.1 hypothetical protein AUC47_06670 [Microbacterium sp. SZ1]